ncbi:putative Diguanylate cyclase [Planktothrix serta PCC 8927]|uniref:Diguanylate cyclase n=1 Tax=Planktothrix serta PCC 8927 TaxID=671068 RepID=A0A7Z9BY10_9CYAN|nr:diguanylate cyclase [Planktothrix serta]VXD24871.1 putative Diguanylate cyclase [Planktothrix serta PCC 8927]
MKIEYRDKEGQQSLRMIYAVGLALIVTTALGVELYYSYQFTARNAEQNIYNTAQLLAGKISSRLPEIARGNKYLPPHSLNFNLTQERSSLDVSVLNTEIKNIDQSQQSVIEILDLELRVITREPNLPVYQNSSVNIQLLQDFVKQNKNHKIAVLRSEFDHKKRIVGIQRVEGYPLIIVIQVGFFDVFFLWYTKAIFYTILVLIIISLLTILIKKENNYLQQTQELMTHFVAIESADDMIVITSKDGTIEYVNPAFTKITGYQANEVIGHKPSLLKSGCQNKDFYQALWKKILSGKGWKGELINRKKDGSTYCEEMTIAPVKNSLGEIIRFVAVKRDISDRKQLEAQLAWLAHFDKLTGLPNRVLFFDRLERAIAQAKRQQTQFAVFFIDLDGFKSVNDCFGHQNGDLLLKEVAKRLSLSVRQSDTVARMGGDEFTLILGNIRQRNDVIKIAQAILFTLSQGCVVNGQECQIGASIGISFYPTDGSDLETLVNQADTAMYRSKHQGKNRYEFASTEEELTRITNYEL